MLIQVRITPATLPRTGEGIAFVRGEIGPAITAVNGSRGFLMAMDHSAGAFVAMAAWSDSAVLAAHEDLVPGLVAEATRHLHNGESTIEVFDLAVSHVVKPLRIGYWGRVTRIHSLQRNRTRPRNASATRSYRDTTTTKDSPPSRCSSTATPATATPRAGTTACRGYEPSRHAARSPDSS